MSRVAEAMFATEVDGGTGDLMNVTDDGIASICADIQSLQRQRVAALKLRMKLNNGLTATIATASLGYHGGLDEKERKKLWREAEKLIRQVDKGDPIESERSSCVGLIRISQQSRQGYADFEESLYKAMQNKAKQLPVASWVDHPDRRGIGIGIVATIIGEAGDLFNYPNPAKLWRRLFGAPFEKNGEVHMPSCWRGGTKTKLSSAEWEEVGYNPRRNATMYQLRENIVMQNGSGPYRRRYDYAKARAKEVHPDWTDGHCHAHGQLLAAKLVVKDLWIAWWGDDAPSQPYAPYARSSV